jgi:hypothetical protein
VDIHISTKSASAKESFSLHHEAIEFAEKKAYNEINMSTQVRMMEQK